MRSSTNDIAGASYLEESLIANVRKKLFSAVSASGYDVYVNAYGRIQGERC